MADMSMEEIVGWLLWGLQTTFCYILDPLHKRKVMPGTVYLTLSHEERGHQPKAKPATFSFAK